MTLACESEDLESRRLCYTAAAMAEIQLQATWADATSLNLQMCPIHHFDTHRQHSRQH